MIVKLHGGALDGLLIEPSSAMVDALARVEGGGGGKIVMQAVPILVNTGEEVIQVPGHYHCYAWDSIDLELPGKPLVVNYRHDGVISLEQAVASGLPRMQPSARGSRRGPCSETSLRLPVE